MRWLLDQGLPRSAADLLRANGHDAIHVSEIGLHAARDEEIVQLAFAEKRAVVTLDADFHRILALTNAVGPSIIRIREEGLKATHVTALIEAIANTFPTQLQEGCTMTYQNERIRIRRLPLQ